MKPNLLLTILYLFAAIFTFGQSFGEMEWQKKKIPAVVTEIPQVAGVTEDAIRQKFTQMGYNAKENRGVYVYKGIRIPEISSETFDVLFRVERKSRRDRDASVVYFAVSRGYENYIKESDDAELTAKMKQYCANFSVWAEAAALEVAIKEQEDKLKSTERKLTDYNDEAESLQRKKKKIEEDIEENKKNTEKQKLEVENQKKALEILRSKRKN